LYRNNYFGRRKIFFRTRDKNMTEEKINETQNQGESE
jgi:hypothetical protein